MYILLFGHCFDKTFRATLVEWNVGRRYQCKIIEACDPIS